MSAIASVVMDNDGTHVTITLDNGGVYRREVIYADAVTSIIPNTGQEKVLELYYDTGDSVYKAVRTDGESQAVEEISTGAAVDHTALIGVTASQHHVKYTDAEVDAILAVHAALTNVHSITRSVTFVVAANDSSVLGKAQADYQCTGTNDHLVIQAALDALAATGGEVRLLDGTYNIGAKVNLDSYQTLSGLGRSTILTTAAGIAILSAVGGSGTEKVDIVISNLSIDGAAVGSTFGVYFEYVDTSRIVNCWITDAEYCVYLENCDSNLISENDVDGNSNSLDLIWLYNSSEHNVVSDNNCYNASSGYGGIVLTLNSNSNTVTGNVCHDNSYGIENFAEDNSIFSNVCENNDTAGIWLYAGLYSTMVGNDCRGNGIGIKLEISNYVLLASNNCHLNDEHGIHIVSSDHNSIVNNLCTENSQDTDDTYDGIYITNSDYCDIANNFCRVGTEANGQRYGINITGAPNDCSNTWVFGNDVYDSGKTAYINDDGTGTIVQHNRGFPDNTVFLTASGEHIFVA